MPAKAYKLKIITSDSVFYEGRVVSAIFPGEIGYLGVLADHAPLITTCVPGKLTFRDEAHQEHRYRAESGFLAVYRNEVTFLTDRVSLLEEVHE